ncbi:helix-turn-helix transcriptional regulator [Ramlibacter sp. RBP-2]|uniref:Helix-turn-helix transcriptional regulator n=1 Tax=Ramlibacter lithotrophicus TaxID=2606681 RepID=A0A7X6I8F0_9BURK|nr:helix-turn-helix transcriptional regulator [Ramlibacter lithotrophicus]NKE68214.1 helix-turn-helix transcriptional regulator [Ramlibacter lithotrophicus]
MANLASMLKSEIARVARRELRAELQGLKKASASYRGEIARLKRRIGALEQQVKRLARPGREAPAVAADEEADLKLRFSAKGLASQRKRLGLSAEAFGALIGASGQSVYKWESGKIRPRARHLPRIAELRGMGKREAAARLQALAA